MQPRTKVLLEDIRDTCQFIVDVTAETTFDEYQNNRLLRQPVEGNFEIMGEAMRRLRGGDPETTALFGSARVAVDFRNVLIPGNDIVDDDRVWLTIRESLPTLVKQVEQEIQRFAGE